ncbi:MAG: putative Ig domain-containing protein [Gammaproteobacteria bacterium]|nr:putative Ig domain-containing protein [Gammaproteobacteria bacterium]
MRLRQKLSTFILPLSIASLSVLPACNWVDSTGRQGNDTPTVSLNDGDVIAELEEEVVVLDAAASDSDGIVESYSWGSVSEQGPLQVCVNDLDLDIAGSSLAEVCEDPDNCEILFIEDENENGVFNVMLPKITAPIGLTYPLSVKDNDGGQTRLDIHFCIDSVNEKPVAGDDQYSVVEGSTLVVDGASAQGLLSNDSDDNDVRNQGLTVLGVANGDSPQYAGDFSLAADGSFTYSISPFTPFTVTQDSFSYEISDGSQVSQATVVLDLSVLDDPPSKIGIIPNQTAKIGIAFGPLDVSGKFFDPEGTALSHSATGLPAGISISNNGIISGTPNASNSTGAYTVTVSASDGQSQVSQDPFTLTLQANQPPQIVSQLADQVAIAGQSFSVNTASSFSDPENQAMTFSASGLPATLSISSTGVISGAPIAAEAGGYTVSVTASDGVGSTVMTFGLTVQGAAPPPNQPPVFSGPVPAQQATAGTPYSFNVAGYFSDPENGPLSFTATGLPNSGSLVISPAGVINGTPLLVDKTVTLFGNSPLTVTVTATDDEGDTANGSFSLTIN